MAVGKPLSLVLLGAALVLLQTKASHAALNLVDRIQLHPAGSGAYYCDYACADQTTRKAFYTARENGAIAVVDMNSRLVTGFLPTGGQPRHIDVSELAHELYFTLPGEQSVGVVSESGGPVTRIRVAEGGYDLVDVAASDTTSRVYVADRISGKITPVKRPENLIEPAISVYSGLTLHSLAVDHSRLRLYAGCGGNPGLGIPNQVLVVDIDPSSALFHTIVDGFQVPADELPKRVAVNEITNRVYAVGGESLVIVDVASRAVRTVHVAPTTESVAVDPVANVVWVGRTCAVNMPPYNNWFVQVDGATEQITGKFEDYWFAHLGIAPDWTSHHAYAASGVCASRWSGTGWPEFIALAYNPTQIALDPVSHRLWVGDAYLDTVHEIDCGANQVTRRLTTEDRAHNGVAFDPAGFVYATSDDRNLRPLVVVLDASTGAEVKSILVHPWPEDIAVNPTSLKAYVACPGSTVVDVIDIDPASSDYWNVIKSIQVDPDPGYGNEPWRLAVDPAQNVVYAVTMGNPINPKPSRIVAIDSTTDEIIRTREFGNACGSIGIACIPALRRLYVGVDRTPGSMGLDILDGDRQSLTFLRTISEVSLPYVAYEVCANHLTNRVYARCEVQGTIAAIDGLSGDLLFKTNSERYATRLAVNSNAGLLYVGAPHTSSILVMHDEVTDNIGSAKLLPDGYAVELVARPVTAGTDQMEGNFYIEEPDRSSGIRVCPAQQVAVAEGASVSVVGVLATLESGERVIEDAAVRLNALPIPEPTPLGMPNRSVGGGDFRYEPGSPKKGQIGVEDGFGLNNIGLLVKTWGRVESVDPASNSFVIDDGSNIDLRCVAPPGVVLPQEGAYVATTGISSCEAVAAAKPARLLRVRKQSDIQPVTD